MIGDAVKGSANASLTHDLKRLHNRGTNPDRSLLIAFGQISRMCEGLGLVRTIKDRACELFKKVADTKGARGRGTPALCAAVIYIACRCARLQWDSPFSHEKAGACSPCAWPKTQDAFMLHILMLPALAIAFIAR